MTSVLQLPQAASSLARCPTCGHAIRARDPIDVMRDVSPTMSEILDVLFQHADRFVSADEIVTHIYRRRPDDEPRWSRSIVHATIHYNRNRLRRMGWDIEGRLGRTGGLRIRAVEAIA